MVTHGGFHGTSLCHDPERGHTQPLGAGPACLLVSGAESLAYTTPAPETPNKSEWKPQSTATLVLGPPGVAQPPRAPTALHLCRGLQEAGSRWSGQTAAEGGACSASASRPSSPAVVPTDQESRR